VQVLSVIFKLSLIYFSTEFCYGSPGVLRNTWDTMIQKESIPRK